MEGFDVTQRCKNCGGSRKEHDVRKPWRCRTRLVESYWEPWTVEEYETAVRNAKDEHFTETDLTT
jgi:hypothetical protein